MLLKINLSINKKTKITGKKVENTLKNILLKEIKGFNRKINYLKIHKLFEMLISNKIKNTLYNK